MKRVKFVRQLGPWRVNDIREVEDKSADAYVREGIAVLVDAKGHIKDAETKAGQAPVTKMEAGGKGPLKRAQERASA